MRLYGVAGFGMLSTCAQAFALELQAFSVLPFQQTTDLVEKLRAQKVAFEELIIPDEIHDLLRWSDWGFQTVTNSGLSFQTSDSEQEQERCIVLRHSFVFRPSSFVLLHSKHVLRGKPGISKQ
ncbi:MAG: hypothetical protein WA849_12070 [Candidatus Udaeobacter sp.]